MGKEKYLVFFKDWRSRMGLGMLRLISILKEGVKILKLFWY